MPYFSWRGVDLSGRVHKGTTFARSVPELDARLFAQKIALMQAWQRRRWRFAGSGVDLPRKIDFFQHLAQLLQAGILLPDALAIVGDQQSHGRFQETIYAVAQQVGHGHSLSHALNGNQQYFDPFMVEIVAVGQESGSLALALQALADYLQAQDAFYKRLRAAVLLPMITFGFFLCVLGVILFAIIPQFATVFSSLGKETPAATRTLLAISSWVSGWRMGALFFALVLGAFLVHRAGKTRSGREFFDVFWLKMPFVGRIIRQRASAHFLHALSLLLDGGVPLVPALAIAKGVVRNSVLARCLETLVAEVSAGNSFSEALVIIQEPLFGPEVISLAAVGLETGRLSFFLARAAQILQAAVYRSIAFVATIIQPLLIVVLGLLIALLIISVYMPVLNLANIV